MLYLLQVIAGQISLLHNSTRNLSAFQRFGFFSSASQPNEKGTENGRTTTESSNDAKENENSDDKGQGFVVKKLIIY